jgi:hypothetical protein
MGGHGYHALSKSEQWRVDVLLQIEIARRDGSDMVVIDGADILDGPARFGLIKALEHAGLRAVVMMTASAPGKVANPAAWSWGPIYWIDHGTAVPLASAISQPAASSLETARGAARPSKAA